MEDKESELEEDIEDGLENNLIYISSINKHININEDIPVTNVAYSTRE